ncbi:Hpt domain-containing protein, partial [Luteimonas panaciterrae]|uniref:Hpt domain-containing protein n=1 Tax=Luteimonas panaciterrae TaxID=363885 RepID=UPI001CFADDF9
MTAALRSAIDYTTLGWVKPELDETLRQARAEIESFAEDPADSEHMRQCVEHMHQVQGTLRMLELYAPAMVAEEMERLAQALQNGEVTDRDAGSTALMRGALLLPDYLERLQSGHRDIPIVLLPLLNELRAARGETGLSETVLFASEPTQVPSEIEIGHAEGSLRGRNRTLLETVAAAVKEELLRVKDVLDLHVRSHGDDVSGLKAQAETLDRVADTLGMLGLGVARGIVQQQRDTVHAIANGQQPADEGTLLDVAGALLYVDATLDEQVARLSDSDVDISQQGRIGNESRKVVETVSREAAVNFADARQAFVAFVETGWDHHQLSEVPRLLTEVAGAMTMLDLPQPAAYLDGMRVYTETELLGRKRIPNGRQLDTVADTLTSLEYYAEALRENRSNRDEILDVAQNSLEALGYWPIPDVIPEIQPIVVSVPEVDEEPVAEVVEVEATEGEVVSAAFVEAPAEVEKTSVAAIHEAVAEAPVLVPVEIPAAAIPAVSATTSGFEDAGDDIDDEIREVFLEEFAEETTNLETLLPAWREQPEDLDRLRPIRRVFHTLKGSGRLVGARTLGEFSWKIESLLNRVLDGARSPTPAVVAVVDRAFETLPQLHAALRGDGPITADLASLQALADRVAEGEEVLAPAVVAPAVAPATVEVATAAAAASLVEEESPVPDEPAPPIPAPPPVVEQKRVPASVDALLLEILDAEVAGHLVTVDAWLAQARSAPTPASDALLRAVHTMNGAFAMAEVPVINEALGPAEAWVRRMLAAKQDASGEGVEAMTELAALIRATVTGLHASSPHVPTCDAVATRLAALRDSLPEVTTSTIGTFASFEDEVEIVQLDDSESLLNGGPASAVTVDETAVATAAAEAILLDEVRRQEESRLEAERLEAERLEAERLEAERLEA